MSQSPYDSKISSNFSTANLIEFSVNRADLTQNQPRYRESFLWSKPIVLGDKETDEYDDSLHLKQQPSLGVKSYTEKLRKTYQDSTISTADPIHRRKKQRIILLKWILLFVSIVGGASFGPFMLYVQTPAALKGVWRMQITLILLLPFIIYEKIISKNGEFFQLKVLFNCSTVHKLLIASMGNALWMICLLISLNYTSIAHAYLFNGIPSLLMIIWRRFKGIDKGRWECLGILMALVGIVVTAFDSTFHSYHFVDLAAVPAWKKLIFGDLTALFGSFFAASFFILHGEIREEYPICFGIAFISFIGAIIMGALAVIFQGATISFSSDTGIFGLFTERWFIYFVYVGLATGISYYIICGFVATHLSAIAISIALYFEPVVSSLIVYFLGWQTFPATLAIIGGSLVIFGMVLISLKQKQPEIMTIADESLSKSYEPCSFVKVPSS